MDVVTVNGEKQACAGVGRVSVRVNDSDHRSSIEIDVCVISFKPLGFDFVLGMNGITSLGGISISSLGAVRFRSTPSSESRVDMDDREEMLCAGALAVEQNDFRVDYDASQKVWTAKWKWAGNKEPELLKNRVAEYSVPSKAREQFDSELERWIEEGWLREYDEREFGPAKGLIPLLAVVQDNKAKVRPVLDYREINSYVDAFTRDADVCAEKMREWRALGVNAAILDLKTAYMQIRVDRSLWPFQTVIFRGRRFCLTRLGFGLSIAPAVMKAVLSAVLSQDPAVKEGTSPFVDDIFVNEDVVKASTVRDHLRNHGLICKPAERVSDGARVLGLSVKAAEGRLAWKRSNVIPEVPAVLTRRSVFSLCGKLIGHLPVCGWLRPAAAYIKRKANLLSDSWDDEIRDPYLRSLVEEVVAESGTMTPVKGVGMLMGEKPMCGWTLALWLLAWPSLLKAT